MQDHIPFKDHKLLFFPFSLFVKWNIFSFFFFFNYYFYFLRGVLFRYKEFIQQKVLNHSWDKVYRSLYFPYPIYIYISYIHKRRAGFVDYQKILLLVIPFCQRVRISVSFSEDMMYLDGPVACHMTPAVRNKGKNIR